MQRLESKVRAPSARAVLTISSLTDFGAVGLSVDERPVRRMVNGEWQDDATSAKQKVFWLTADGPQELVGIVPVDDAVSCSVAFRVVVEIEIDRTLKPAFQAGGVSKEFAAVSLVAVREVWESQSKQIYGAKEVAVGSAQMMPDGHIKK